MNGQEGGGTLDPATAPGWMSSSNWNDKITEYALENYQLYFSDLQTGKDARDPIPMMR